MGDIKASSGWLCVEECRLHYVVWSDEPSLVSEEADVPACADSASVLHRCKPAVVLLHGFMQSSATWDDLAASLAQDFCVYALDFLGHGKSDASHDSAHYTYEAAVSYLDAFLRRVVCAQRPSCHVVGYSMGGRIALGLLSTSTDIINSMMLEGCNLGCETPDEQRQSFVRNAEWAAMLRRDGIEKFVRYWENLPLFATQRARGLDTVLRAERLAHDPEALALCLEGMGKHAMPLACDARCALRACVQTPECTDHQHEQRRFSVECMLSNGRYQIRLLYIGGAQDAKSTEIAHELEQLGAQTCLLPTGHNAHVEEPARYLEVLRAFLA